MSETSMAEALEWLRREGRTGGHHPDSKAARTILAALPEDVTNPKPELPTEDGWYTSGGYYPPIKLEKGTWLWSNGVVEDHPENLLPLTRLVPEGPPLLPDNLLRTIEDNWTHPEGTHNMAAVIAAYVNGERS